MDEEEIRFIPACTGNTFLTGSPHEERAVHPRVYGEYSTSTPSGVPNTGSSPRVRGIRARS